MRINARARISVTAVAVVVVAAAAALAWPGDAGSAEPVLVTISGPGSKANCSPCHPEAGSVANERLVFEHAPHIAVQCAVCHDGPAHAGGATAVPAMDRCFTCHGLAHGPTGLLASSECQTCHPPTFDLRPPTHVAGWAGEPHAEASSSGVNSCMMCHSAPADCDACHASEVPDLGRMPLVYLSTLPRPAAESTVTVDIAGPVTMSQCVYCHPDIDDFAVPGLVFTHEPHLQRAYRCESCHPVFPHSIMGTDRPAMRPCTRCHGLTHGSQGEVASLACEVCHTPDFELMPADHTLDFRVGTHKDPALEDAGHCTQCHRAGSCTSCHNGQVTLADGRAGAKVVPQDHLKAQWSSEHGGLYLAQKGLCAVCHDSPSCQRCHVTTMPHPGTWLADHARGKDSLVKDCQVCHRDRETCQECHHNAVRAAALIPENCVDCHEEMKTEPATAITDAGLAEHAVHFGVAEEKGEPYYCDDCHIGFGRAGIHVVNPATGPHDMRVCYECHGGLDIYNVQIAPWPGAELCRRCHTDLNI